MLLELSIGLLMTRYLALPYQVMREREEHQDGSYKSFYNLTWEIMFSHFCRILLIRSNALSPAYIEGRGIKFERKNIKDL